MIARSLLSSLVLHCLLLYAGWHNHGKSLQQKATIQLEFVAPKTKNKKFQTGILNNPARLGSKAYRLTKRPLGITLASEHYLARLHAHIDPNWYTAIRLLAPVSCSSVLHITANRLGTVTEVIIASTNCPKIYNQKATETFWRANLLPPPAIFLDKSGQLALEWTFVLQTKAD